MKHTLIKQTLIVSSTLLALLIAGSAMADDGAKLDKRGDRIEEHLDKKGDHIEDRLDEKADKARANGHEERAEHLENKGDKIDQYLDKKGERINHRLDKRADRRK